MTQPRERPRGIEELEPGDHLCCIYETEEEHRAVLTPFLRQGLARHQKVVYIVDARTAEAVLGYLRDDGVDVEPYLKSGQLVILTRDDAYMRTGVFDPDGMIALLRSETDKALAEGYSALRATGEMTWALRGLPGSDRLIEYESKLNDFFPTAKALAICQYDRRRFSSEVLLDVLHTHPIVVIGTEICRNFYYLPPDVFFTDLPGGRLQQWTRALADHERDEVRVRFLNRLYRTITEINQLIVHEKDADRLLGGVCRIAVEHGGFRMAWVGFADRNIGVVRSAASAGVGRDLADEIEANLDAARGPLRPAARAIVEDRTVVVADTERDPGFAPWRESTRMCGFRSCAAFPVRVDGAVKAVVKVYSADANAFQGEEVTGLEELAADLGYALHAIETEELRRRAEDAATAQFKLAETFFNNSVSCLVILDRNYNFLRVNEAYARACRRDISEFAGKNHFDMYPSDAKLIFDEVVRTKRPFETFTRAFVFPDQPERGTTYWDWTLVPILDAGGEVEYLVFSLNEVTEHKRAEEALRLSEERYRLLFERNVAGVFRSSVDGRILDCNAAFARMFGFDSPAEALRYRAADLHPESQDRETFLTFLRERGAVENLEKEYRRKDGSAIWVLESVSLVPDEKGELTIIEGTILDITERKRAEDERRAASLYARRLIEASVDPLVTISPHGTIMDVNEATERATGVPRDRLIGSDFSSYFTEPDKAREGYERVLSEGVVRDYPLTIRHTSGATMDVLYNATVYRDEKGDVQGVFADARDVTEHKRAEEERRHLAAAVEQAAETIVITATDGTIEYVNPAFTLTTGYTREEALGQNPRILKSGRQDGQFYKGMWDALLRSEVWHGHFHNKRKDGTLLEEDATISPVRDETGAIGHFVAVKRDISQEVALEAQLRQSQKLEAIGTLAGGVAHDFNNILQAMLSHTQVLRSHPHDAARVAHIAEELEQQVRRGAALTRQLLLFSRRETAKPQRLDLNKVAQETMGMLRRLVRENIAFALECAPAPLPVNADRGQLEQVLMNLVVNAADAMPTGGKIAIRTGSEGADAVSFSVADTGSGIPDEIRERIFEPFFTTKHPGKGTGLGLSVVHGIVSRHGGRIEMASEFGRGSTFHIVLPRATTEATVPAHPVSAVPEREMPSGHGERVLVVEDEEAARAGLKEIIETLGYVVTAARSAEEAERLAPDQPYDALLSDLMLPGESGAELAVVLRQRWPRMQVILMSGYTEDEALRRGISAGAVRFLQKPFDMDALARELRAALDEAPSRSGR